jgi:hypothetical protein
MTVSAANIPTLTLGTVSSKYNPDSKIRLTGIITAQAFPYYASWSAYLQGDSGSLLPLAAYSLTDTINVKNSPTPQEILQLGIKPNCLVAGSTYVFKLTAAYYIDDKISEYSSYAEAIIVINERPTLGT